MNHMTFLGSITIPERIAHLRPMLRDRVEEEHWVIPEKSVEDCRLEGQFSVLLHQAKSISLPRIEIIFFNDRQLES